MIVFLTVMMEHDYEITIKCITVAYTAVECLFPTMIADLFALSFEFKCSPLSSFIS